MELAGDPAVRIARRPLVALFPTFGLFCYTALLSSDVDRVTGTVLYLATALLFLAVADRPPGRRAASAATATAANRRRLSWPTGTATALVIAAVAVAVPLAASPALARPETRRHPLPPRRHRQRGRWIGGQRRGRHTWPGSARST